jgi:hypothetical protein
MALVIVHEPGMAPRLGHTMGDEIESVREWRSANPSAAVYVVMSSMDLPTPGTSWVTTADEMIAIADEPDYDDDEPECDRCHGDGRDPWNDYLLPCPLCQGEQH